MKLFSAGKPVKRSVGMNCLLVNQFATPGLGSLMGGRILEGVVQLLFAVGGFLLFLIAFLVWMGSLINQFGASANMNPFPAYGKIGVILFITSWLLAWVTSVSILREATRAERQDLLANKPPKLKGD